MGDFVTGLRVQHVCRALAQTDTALAKIAADAGFVDQSHLTRVFREALGTTPAKYRRAHRAAVEGNGSG
jgi:AraC family transcriptional regulator